MRDYLVAVMDWHSKKVLSWKLSNTMDADFCVAAVEEALAKHGKPDIFNTDQGSQFTSFAFINVLRKNNIRIPMDAVAVGWTTCLSSAPGEASSMKASICTPLEPALKLVRGSADGSTFITSSGRTAAWEGYPRTCTTNKGF